MLIWPVDTDVFRCILSIGGLDMDMATISQVVTAAVVAVYGAVKALAALFRLFRKK